MLTSPIVCTASRTSQTAVATIPRPGGCREYVRYGLFQAYSVYSRVQSTCLTTCKAAVWYPVTALNPSGFSPELVRSASTCMNSAFTRSLEIFSHPCPKAEMQQMTMNEGICHDFEKQVLTLSSSSMGPGRPTAPFLNGISKAMNQGLEPKKVCYASMFHLWE
jgi:hypothetical protein